MKIKKIVAVAMATAVLVTAAPMTGVLPGVMSVTLNAVEIEGDWTYSVNDDGETVTITKYNGTDAEVDIPETLSGKKVKSIGDKAFMNCTSLTNVTIPDDVTTIGCYAFSNCRSLTSVTIPDGVTTIDYWTFDSCISLESVTIPYGVTEIRAKAFASCFALASVMLPDSVTEIGGDAFSGCASLTSVTIPYGVTKLNYGVFSSCYSLTSVEIPDSVMKINSQAFSGCVSLKNMIIPDSVTEIVDTAFTSCKSLEEFVVGEGNANYSVVDGILFNKDKTVLVCYPAGKEDTSYSIPVNVTKIDGYAFNCCSSLTSVTIPDNVTEIGSGAFGECTSLTNVIIPNGIKIISSGTFFDCTSLSNVTISSSVTGIHYQAFGCCTMLTDVYFSGSQSQWEKISIEESNEPLINATIHFAKEDTIEPNPSDHTELKPGDTFVDGILEYKVLEDGTLEVKGFANEELKETVEELIIPDEVKGKTVTNIGARAFFDCKFTSVAIPGSVTSIESYAFSGCKLTSAAIPDGVTNIGNGAFWSCNSLESVMISNSVTGIDENAFGACSSLKEICVDENNEWFSSLDGVLFNKDQTKLICYPAGKDISYDIPSGVTEIGNHAFDYCRSLISVTIPDSVTSIGSAAFWGCASLESLTIPDGITIINLYTFWGCSSLKSLTVPDSVTSVDPAFEHCNALTDVYFGGSKSQWEKIDIYDSVVNDPLINATIHFAKEDAEELKPGDTFVDGILEYKVLEDGTLEVKGFANEELKETVEELIIPDEVKGKAVANIGEYAFFDCKFTSVAIPGSVMSIGNYAFSGCKLISVVIPDGLTSIGKDAFWSCRSLESVMISNSVTGIDGNAFGACFSLKEVCVDENNELFSSVDGVLFNKEQTKLICYPAGKDISYDVPGGVTEIGSSAFDYCISLTSVTIPDSVTSINSAAFWGCASLESITIPNGVTIINLYTFCSCTSLKSVTIPDSVTRIDPSAFDDCKAFTDVYFGGSKSQWEKIYIQYAGNDPLINATIHFAKEDTVETEPEETKPDETQPEDTKPDETQPEETKPDETQPEDTKPDETQPEETKPDETQPEDTKPDETQPEDTKPDETQPEDTKPDETQPEDTKPDETQPEDTKPDETQPEDTKPDETQPEDTKPDETQPEDTKPDETQPEETKPDETQPEDTKPDETQPEDTKPDVTQPEGPKPNETQPEDTKPDETQPEGTRPDETQIDNTKTDETQTTETEPDSTDKKYEISTDVEIPHEAADISEDDTVKSITINVFNMKNKGEIDLSKVTIKAQEIYDVESLKRAEEALGKVLNGNTHYNLLDLTLLYKGEDFSNGYEGLIQVKFKIPHGHKNKTFSCYRLTEVDGKMVKEVIPGTQTEDYYIIYLEHFSLYALVAVGDEVSTESESTSVTGDDNRSQTANPNTGVTAVATAFGIAAFSGAAVLIACKKRR